MSFTQEELQAMLADTGMDLPEEGSKFEINSLERLTWAMRKIEENQEKITVVKAVAQSETKRISNWADKETKQHQDNIDNLSYMINEYMLKEREANAKFKKASTPYGEVVFKKQQTKWEYKDEVAAAKSLQAMGKEGLLTKVPEKMVITNKTDVKKHLVYASQALVEVDKDGIATLVEVFEPEKSDFAISGDKVIDGIDGEITNYELWDDVAYDVITYIVLLGTKVYDQPDKITIGGA